jgi:anthranilate 1,2-dioxygenase small subunit
MTASIVPDALAEIDALQVRYVRSLDRREWTEWLACFSREGSYVCLSRENEEQGLPLPLMMDDCAERLRDRVKMITEVWAGTYEEYATRHFVQRLEARALGPSRYAVESNVLVAYTNRRGISEILVAGSYRDEIVFEGGGAVFIAKTAVLDTIATPRYLVYPV